MYNPICWTTYSCIRPMWWVHLIVQPFFGHQKHESRFTILYQTVIHCLCNCRGRVDTVSSTFLLNILSKAPWKGAFHPLFRLLIHTEHDGRSHYYRSNAYGHELNDSYLKLLILASAYPGEIYEHKRPYYYRLETSRTWVQALAGIGRCGRICLGVAGHMTSYVVYCDRHRLKRRG